MSKYQLRKRFSEIDNGHRPVLSFLAYHNKTGFDGGVRDTNSQ